MLFAGCFMVFFLSEGGRGWAGVPADERGVQDITQRASVLVPQPAQSGRSAQSSVWAGEREFGLIP